MKVCSRCKEQPQQKNHCYCKVCHATYHRERYRKKYAHKPRIKELVERGKRKDHPAQRMFHSAAERARKKGIEFDLDLWKLEVPQVCPVLGIPLDRRDIQHAPSLDRVDPKRGYTHDNVRIISFRANSIKQDATADEIKRVLEYMINESNPFR